MTRSKLDRRSAEWKQHLNEVRKAAGSKGGTTTALRHCASNPDWAKTRAARGGTATLARYGRDYFQHIAIQARKLKAPEPTSKTPSQKIAMSQLEWALEGV